jgi:hypothetical protein
MMSRRVAGKEFEMTKVNLLTLITLLLASSLFADDLPISGPPMTVTVSELSLAFRDAKTTKLYEGKDLIVTGWGVLIPAEASVDGKDVIVIKNGANGMVDSHMLVYLTPEQRASQALLQKPSADPLVFNHMKVVWRSALFVSFPVLIPGNGFFVTDGAAAPIAGDSTLPD